ncbi:hypothetical protein SAMN03080617_01874 [Algoriphagus alkaliphilus]|uniref:Lipoprotein n=1 Tax=Algoriphagus alkaliphilus TaxID=279824 RepID=A0A1G5XPD6_9BACT|nr:hypothetical protein [Algoriphagus alkaliphilus]MBA4302367.1 hypothetical protein [Cyclobacterium sp.]SDA71557.1 hypothetical protein SAMN03080617_01874 [Algoriphagus alkaliphilus]
MLFARSFLFLTVLLSLGSCSCEPEDIARLALSGMENLMGKGFIPSEEIRALGKFQGMSVNLSQSTVEDSTESTIYLKLENGDPAILGYQPEILARKCAEIYLRDFVKSANYQKITVQFILSDPSNPENIAMQEYTFDIADF